MPILRVCIGQMYANSMNKPGRRHHLEPFPKAARRTYTRSPSPPASDTASPQSPASPLPSPPSTAANSPGITSTRFGCRSRPTSTEHTKKHE
ncbi:hypothetical protein FIBSPDRAFT_467306 [Athelia psychrophila]|uniref:Uncharacterized protein n=1 Tax=Athelia psychrophila TaxID=1759441 RepID=A0A167U3J8_9AGAM|nr:hypothetical protein FIBSPDRAFT_467306 [Fibularhizoctonia sp. CBS 109695]